MKPKRLTLLVETQDELVLGDRYIAERFRPSAASLARYHFSPNDIVVVENEVEATGGEPRTADIRPLETDDISQGVRGWSALSDKVVRIGTCEKRAIDASAAGLLVETEFRLTISVRWPDNATATATGRSSTKRIAWDQLEEMNASGSPAQLYSIRCRGNFRLTNVRGSAEVTAQALALWRLHGSKAGNRQTRTAAKLADLIMRASTQYNLSPPPVTWAETWEAMRRKGVVAPKTIRHYRTIRGRTAETRVVLDLAQVGKRYFDQTGEEWRAIIEG